MFIINMVNQPRINFDIEITLVAVEFHSHMLFYNVDFQIDLWICLKSYKHHSLSVPPKVSPSAFYICAPLNPVL